MKKVLISVSDKNGIVEFAKQLNQCQFDILSTGGTARLLREANIPVTDVSDYTGFPEIMDGRVKTLHPKVHGGLLGRVGTDDEVMSEHGITPIDMVVVNLYPFQQTIAKPDCSYAEAIEQIDIGGPCMIRAASKNAERVTVLVDPADYPRVIEQIEAKGETELSLRQELAGKAFAHTAQYDLAIANHLNTQILRYGENPHQKAGIIMANDAASGELAQAKQEQGKPLSYNNLADSDAALACVKTFTDQPACVIVKHANPCGVAIADNLTEAYQRAFATDSTSAFGGIIAFNQALDADTAQTIIDQQFVEVIIAPEIKPDALTVLANKKNLRALSTGYWDHSVTKPVEEYKVISGGILIQSQDQALITSLAELTTVSKRQPTETELTDLLFAWKVAKYVKSNAIVYAKAGQTIGIGAGQMSRIDSARIAGIKAEHAGLEVAGSVMASDAFFPFRDGIDTAAQAGVTAIIQPGGSIRDEEVIAAANEANIAMVFTGMRHFRH